MTNNKPVGIGFIGAGEVSILHAKAVKSIPEARLIGLWNRSTERAIQRAQDYNCRRYETPEELVKDPEIDAVFVLTDLDTHLPYARLAMEHGKHVLVEKPLAATVAEVEEMKFIAERLRAGLRARPQHDPRGQPCPRQGADRKRGHREDRLLLCHVQHPPLRGARLDAAGHGAPHPHPQYLHHDVPGGTAQRVSCMVAMRHYEKLSKEDLAMVLLDLECGGIAHLCASFAADDLSADPWTFLVKVIGTEGTTRYTYQDWVEAKHGISHSRLYTAYQGTITNEDRHFVNVCLRGGQPLSTMDDAIWAQKTVEACERSIADGKTVPIE